MGDAAVGAMEMHLEIQTGKAMMLSVDQLIECTPNPKHCGGAGGCDGATAEAAFEYVQQVGLAREMHYRGCNEKVIEPFVKIDSWRRLPENDGNALLAAVGSGPVVVAVDAQHWPRYSKGIFQACDKDAWLQHAVLVVGYGQEERPNHPSRSISKYWRIRNSWGKFWGENGFLRLLRHDRSDVFCGTDFHPEDGLACEGDTSPMRVCGMCGILTDAAHPVDLSFN